MVKITLVGVLTQLEVVVFSFNVVLTNLQHLSLRHVWLRDERACHLLHLEDRLGIEFLVVDLLLHVPRIYLQVADKCVDFFFWVAVAEQLGSTFLVVAAVNLENNSVTNHRPLITLKL